MTDLIKRAAECECPPNMGCNVPSDHCRCELIEDMVNRIETLEAALLEIFDHECRTSDRSFIACTARDALWPRAALAGEKKE